jgi:hypothetical protein
VAAASPLHGDKQVEGLQRRVSGIRPANVSESLDHYFSSTAVVLPGCCCSGCCLAPARTEASCNGSHGLRKTVS